MKTCQIIGLMMRNEEKSDRKRLSLQIQVLNWKNEDILLEIEFSDLKLMSLMNWHILDGYTSWRMSSLSAYITENEKWLEIEIYLRKLSVFLINWGCIRVKGVYLYEGVDSAGKGA